MNTLLPPTVYIGAETTSGGLKIARLVRNWQGTISIELKVARFGEEDVKPLYIDHPVFVTAIGGRELLVRQLHLTVTKKKDIDASLAFQAEPLLPYPVEQALLAYDIASTSDTGADLTLFAVRREDLEKKLADWRETGFEPEIVSPLPSALAFFGRTFAEGSNTYLIVHLQAGVLTTLLIVDKKLQASFSVQGTQDYTLDRLKQEIAKIAFALAKECSRGQIEGVIITGDGVSEKGFAEAIASHISLPLLNCKYPPKISEINEREALIFAAPIGLAMSALAGKHEAIDFRHGDLAYPHPWKRLKTPVALYFIAILLLAFAIHFYGKEVLDNKKSEARQHYVDLLAAMNKSAEEFEAAFRQKNPSFAKEREGLPLEVSSLTMAELEERLLFLQKEFQSSADSFPLFANVPRVSDVLAWLSTHSAVVSTDEQGNRETKLNIESFNYTMVKRPALGKKQDKYQVKVDIELSAETPKLAREFHDALIAPNDMVDPKAEVKWGSNRGFYRTSFFLKDKTIYPGT